MSLSWLLMAAHVPADGHQGGMVRYVVELAQELARHPDVDLHVVAAAQSVPFWQNVVASDDHIHPMRPAPAPVPSWLELQGRGSRAFERSFDVVHGTKHILPRKHPGLGMLTVHDFLPLDRPYDFGPLKRRLLPGPYLESIARADALACVSAATRDRLACYAPDAVDRARVIPLAGGALTRHHPQPVADLEPGRFALVVGDASRRKNLRLLTEIWPYVEQQVPGATLAIVGPPTWKGDGASNPDPVGVQRLGFLPDAQLAWCYRNARVVLCPSLLEGFGLPAREAMDLGAAVITSDDPALCEASGHDARHVPALDRATWAQAIIEALAEPPEHQVVAMRTWADVAEETVEAARDALAS